MPSYAAIHQELLLQVLTVASTVILSVMFIPQIVRLLREKKSEGISLMTFSLSVVVQSMAVMIGKINNDPHNMLINLVSMTQLIIVIVIVVVLRIRSRKST